MFKIVEMVGKKGFVEGVVAWWRSLPPGVRASMVWAAAGLIALYITWATEMGGKE